MSIGVSSQRDAPETAFPAGANVPGQAESRTAYQKFLAREGEIPWWDDYLMLRQAGHHWRHAAYIAWESSPQRDRWPATQDALAKDVLGLKSARTIRNWRKKYPEMEETIAMMQIAPLMRHRRDVIDALIEVAITPHPKAHSDRKLFLQMTGDVSQAAIEVDTTVVVTADDMAAAKRELEEWERERVADSE